MFGRECTLCGGKLNGSRICTECGLNNNKTEKYYKPNTSSCDYEPLTHVHKNEEKDDAHEYHEEEEQQETVYIPISRRFGNQSIDNSDKKRWFTIVTIIITIIGLGASVFSTLNPDDSTDQSMDVVYNPYQNVVRELSEEGEPADYSLTSGNYIVGVHIPEGRYWAETVNEFDYIQVQDHENGVYLYEYKEMEDNHLDDLRLYDGALVRIGGESEVALHTEHAQSQSVSSTMPNPLTEPVTISSGRSVAGMDFPAGIYDVSLTTKTGAADVIIDKIEGYQISYLLHRDNTGVGEDTFQYMVLPEGAVIDCKEDSQLELIPTANIVSTDYDGFHR